MTKLKMEVIPDFDVLKWKAETQAEILRETEGMTDAEVGKYFQKASEQLRKEKVTVHGIDHVDAFAPTGQQFQ